MTSDYDPASTGWLGRGTPLLKSGGLLSSLAAPPNPGREFARLGWRGLQALAPNLTSLLAGETPPPLPNVPETPGKIPSTADPRVAGAMSEAANIGINFFPIGGPATEMARAGLAGLMRRGASTVAPEAESLASKSARLYNAPVKPQRPFSADYPQGAPADATGRLLADIEGRPLGAEYVAGRNMVGQGEKALSPAELDAIATKLAGSPPQSVAAREIGGDAGRLTWLRYRPDPLRDYQLLINRGLSPQHADRVLGHETGHLIHELAGRIPTAGLNTELRQVYNTLNTGQERTRHLTGPQHVGYKGDSIPHELMAEAIRGYMADPNYLKTVAPKTAAAIREAVNAHPTLSRIIQFNAIAGPVAMGIDPDSLPVPQQFLPVLSQ